MNLIGELKQKLVTACKILDTEGVMDELGHFSVRIPGEDRVLMNGKVSPGQATEEDMVLLDLDGNKLEGTLTPAKEIPLHLALYQKRPDVSAIAHTHSPTIVALSIAGVTLRAVDNLGAAVFGLEAPVFEEYGLVDSFDMGYRIFDAMGSHNMIVLKGHGNIVTGKSLEGVCVYTVWAEKAARLQYQAMLLGEPHWYPENEIKKIRKQMSEGKGYERAWNYFEWRSSQASRS
jgi:HCOMODA/2-hydroxy-3-carboxy-muconic semialdehyde decarboxylase